MVFTATFALGFQIDSALQIRTATEPFEMSQLRAVLDAEHYLKAGHPAGHVIWQLVYEHDPEDSSENLVAVLCWAGAAKRLKDPILESAGMPSPAPTASNSSSSSVASSFRRKPAVPILPANASASPWVSFPTRGRKNTVIDLCSPRVSTTPSSTKARSIKSPTGLRSASPKASSATAPTFIKTSKAPNNSGYAPSRKTPNSF